MSFMEMDKAFVANTYNRFPVEIVSGEGSKCYDVNGKAYVDMGSGIGVTAFGFNDAAWKAAVTEQLGSSGFHPFLVGKAKGGNADTGAQINILLAACISDDAALAGNQLHRKPSVGAGYIFLI